MDSPSGSSTAHEESYMPDEWAENESFGELADEKIRAAERIEMDDISWAKLKGSSVKKVAKSREEAIEEAKAFDVSNRSTIVTSSDGANLAIYIKDALSICFKEDPSRDLRTCFEQAVEDLITIYKPPESKDDRRHRATKSAEEDVMLGVYHFTFWRESGKAHKDPELSSDLKPKKEAEKDAVETFFRRYAPLAQAVGMWMEKLAPKEYERYHQCYNRLAEADKLGPLHQTRRGTFIGLALLINRIVNPHKDSGDVKDGWTVTLCWGNFEGADAVYPGLRRMFRQRPMDLMMTRASVLEHWNTDLTSGRRFCTTFFSKSNVMEPKAAPYKCESCPSTFARPNDLRSHYLTVVRKFGEEGKLKGDHDIQALRARYGWNEAGYTPGAQGQRAQAARKAKLEKKKRHCNRDTEPESQPRKRRRR